MTEKTFTVLFLSRRNSARSVLAEAFLNKVGKSQFRAYSAAVEPAPALAPQTIQLLKQAGLSAEGLRPKHFREFAKPGAQPLDFVFTLSDTAAGEAPPEWPGQPITAHWSSPDPALATGAEWERMRAFVRVLIELERRIRIFMSLPLPKLDRMSLQTRLNEIGSSRPLDPAWRLDSQSPALGKRWISTGRLATAASNTIANQEGSVTASSTSDGQVSSPIRSPGKGKSGKKGDGTKAIRVQYGALPYRVQPDGSVEFLLVTTRQTRRWIIPKGWPIKGMKPAKSAAQEAYEEAGVRGAIESEPIGSYLYEKVLEEGVSVPCEVSVFSLRVEREHKSWPERREREVRWLAPAETLLLLEEPGLRDLISIYLQRVTGAARPADVTTASGGF
ncbi:MULTISPECIES: arsenate reductase/protein-tyrosine-phosphatase family protein [Inquilinus]|uniref:Protein-tyrosine-phosphatase/8-oxo-dGTP pyrophosphatase MutT (NUDIX family) n=1 Tax=Inquilinus ginsengisoli TaxID=363840 RepID=A0ABU1JRH3_9PROT|nr:NUDIX domain-containing protein [Inquilinus ginsengisoli]MDR6291197.1 protein-tyrosine-phosphatase/8-oxo-dGTP pyrophosphatase MutT (NUDIX family) [Inquilinus ginsengisoli]